MIEFEGVTKIYRMGEVELRALNDVSLTIDSGELVAIMGPSGSGNSTTMNILGWLDVPSEGSYRLDGADVGGMRSNQLGDIRTQRIGFGFQAVKLLPRINALRNVELPMVYGGAANRRHKAVEALEQVGVATHAKHLPAELSGGQQQRVAIARAIITDPVMIRADEPTGNVDTRTTDEIMTILAEQSRPHSHPDHAGRRWGQLRKAHYHVAGRGNCQ